MSPLDWAIVAVVLLLTLGLAAVYARRASRSTDEFFATGRSMPWWLAGTSMVATTFAADTPLAVAELVAQSGVAGNWLWWYAALGGILTVFFFARLWQRSGVLTDVELVELRYDGAPAAWLRGVKAVYFGLFANAIVIGWVVLAMTTVFRVLFPGMTIFGATEWAGLSAPTLAVGGLMLLVGVYSMIAGLWGIAITDVFQFCLAMVGSVALAWYALDIPEVGGIAGLKAALPAEAFRFTPVVGNAVEGAATLALSGVAFAAYLGVQWWASWYPGAEPGGGGYVAQRMLATRSETDSVLAVLWFAIAHYCIRPWPWIIVGLAALVLYPGLETPGEGYVLVMRDALPSGLLGLLFAAFLAAFMSTISTQLNWGTSYLVNDLYRRFMATGRSERHYVLVSRVLTLALAVGGFLLATQLDSVSGAWGLLLSASAGMGLVLILRWYWWRINAWSELVATVVPLAMVGLQLVGVDVPFLTSEFPTNLFGIAAITTVSWLVATFVTAPTGQATLDTFYRRVRPGGPGWRPVAARQPEVEVDTGLGRLFVQWLAGSAAVYAALFGIGWLVLGEPIKGAITLAVAVAVIFALVRSLRADDAASISG
ncbi:sodium:solute symporter family protein [Rubrivirga sp. IMCC45206]|uniref:sodium:solute symporter family protein n=1 Tax=Rubrivirga sp. IMCC45206 TaxID=3391614 RepID=UPI00398FF24D